MRVFGVTVVLVVALVSFACAGTELIYPSLAGAEWKPGVKYAPSAFRTAEKPMENYENATEKIETEPGKRGEAPPKLEASAAIEKTIESQKIPESIEKDSEKLEKVPENQEKKTESIEKAPENLEGLVKTPNAPEKTLADTEKSEVVPNAGTAQEESVKSEEARVSYSGTQLWRVDASKNPESLKTLLEKIELKAWLANETTADLVVRPEKSKEVEAFLRERGLSFTVSIEDLQAAINDENPQLSEEELELQGRKGHRMTWNHYHRAQDIFGFLDYVAQTYPDVCSIQTIGTSVEGRPLKVLKIAGRPGSPSLWVDGGIHAREWITPASVTYLINELVENRASYESWLSKVNLHILPLINPDGYEHTHIGDRLWRKNRRSTGGFAQCSGTDLNRNWGYKWGGDGASNSPCRETYRGSGPFSEPETNAVQRHILSLNNVKGYLTFHSYGQYILYPWGYGRFVPPDHVELQRVGQKIATAMKATSGLPYRVGPSGATLYPAAGGSDDWAKGTANIKYPYTVELRDTGSHGFVLPASHIKSSGKEVVAAVETLAKEIS